MQSSLRTFIRVQPIEILRYDLVQRHVHICAKVVEYWNGEQGKAEGLAVSRVPFRTSKSGSLLSAVLLR